MKIYLDNCCYGRPFDDMVQPDVKSEAMAVGHVVKFCKKNGVGIIGSPALMDEITAIDEKYADIRDKILSFYRNTVTEFISSSADIVLRARELMTCGLKEYDNYHLSFAEAAGATYLLTTDKKFIRRVENNSLSEVKVINPLNFLPEVQKWLR